MQLLAPSLSWGVTAKSHHFSRLRAGFWLLLFEFWTCNFERSTSALSNFKKPAEARLLVPLPADTPAQAGCKQLHKKLGSPAQAGRRQLHEIAPLLK